MVTASTPIQINPLHSTLIRLDELAKRGRARASVFALRGGRLASDYWASSQERGREAFKLLDLLVLQATAVIAGAAFFVAATLAPEMELGIFALYLVVLGTLVMLGIGLLSSLVTPKAEASLTTAGATSVAGRRRRVLQARLRWLRVILKRRRPTTPNGPGLVAAGGRPSWA